MIIYLFYLSLFLSQVQITNNLSSAIYNNGVLTVFDQYDSSFGNKPSVTNYTLKNGPVSDILSSSNTTKTTPKQGISNMVFLQLPSTLTKDKPSQLWLMVNNEESTINSTIIRDDEWTYRWNGADTVSDNSLISKPDIENFPRGGFSVTEVNINSNSYLYVLGGIIYSTKLNATAVTNYFYQYDFNAKKWTDLSSLTNNIFPPTSNHKTLQVGNSLIAIPAAVSTIKTPTIPQYTAYKYCSMTNNIDRIYKFDLQSNKWSGLDVDINMSNSSYPSKILYGRSLSVYNGTILAYAQVATIDNQKTKPVIGSLDLNKLQWSWNSSISNTEIFQGVYPIAPESIIINDQLLLINGANSVTRYKTFSILDLNTISFISTIDIGNGKDSNKNNNIIIPPVQVFPTYAIAIIVLLCLGIIIILGWLYYRKSSKLKNAKEFEENMEAVWASSDIKQDTQYSKNRGSKYNKNTSNALDSNTTDPSNNEDTETTFNETNIMNLPFFQHEVDIEDLSPLNAADQENTG